MRCCLLSCRFCSLRFFFSISTFSSSSKSSKSESSSRLLSAQAPCLLPYISHLGSSSLIFHIFLECRSVSWCYLSPWFSLASDPSSISDSELLSEPLFSSSFSSTSSLSLSLLVLSFFYFFFFWSHFAHSIGEVPLALSYSTVALPSASLLQTSKFLRAFSRISFAV